jgi:hypothetical protein
MRMASVFLFRIVIVPVQRFEFESARREEIRQVS